MIYNLLFSECDLRKDIAKYEIGLSNTNHFALFSIRPNNIYK